MDVINALLILKDKTSAKSCTETMFLYTVNPYYEARYLWTVKRKQKFSNQYYLFVCSVKNVRHLI